MHAQRGITGVPQHHALRTLYDVLLARAPSVGVAVGRVAAILEAGDLDTGERDLATLAPEDVQGYQPYWVTRARLAELRGQRAAMHAALQRALGLTEDPAVRQFLSERLAVER